jgi:hypothetical protein
MYGSLVDMNWCQIHLISKYPFEQNCLLKGFCHRMGIREVGMTIATVYLSEDSGFVS